MSEIHVMKDTMARRFEMSIDIEAPVEAVWKALTEARELTRWFPLEASVTPGEGGSVTWGWGDAWSWPSDISAWEPDRHLRLVETRQAFDADGRPLDHPGDHRDLVLDVTLQSHAGRTRLRLVHSGFGHGANWDDELDGISTGWQFELRSLRHYVERYRGRDRVVAWARGTTDLTPADAWNRMLSGGIVFDNRPPQAGFPAEGERFSLTLWGTERFSGTVALAIPNEFAGYVDGLEGGILRIDAFSGGGRTGMILWMVSYDEADRPRLTAFESAAQAFLDATFGAMAAPG